MGRLAMERRVYIASVGRQEGGPQLRAEDAVLSNNIVFYTGREDRQVAAIETVTRKHATVRALSVAKI